MNYHTTPNKWCKGVMLSNRIRPPLQIIYTNMKPVIIKEGRRIVGFVNQRADGRWFYAFGKPSQNSYIAFDCDSKEAGINKVNQYK